MPVCYFDDYLQVNVSEYDWFNFKMSFWEEIDSFQLNSNFQKPPIPTDKPK